MLKGLYFVFATTFLAGILVQSNYTHATDATVRVYGNEWLKDSCGKPCGPQAPGCVYSGGSPSDPNGVPVCYPANSGDHCGGQEAVVAGVAPDWFQCVELAQRLYSRKGWYNGRFGVPTAARIYTNALHLGFGRYPNGSITNVAPGDMIVHTIADGGYCPAVGEGCGHVAVIDTVQTDPIHGFIIKVKEQNWNNSGTEEYYWSNGLVNRKGFGTERIQGVVHSPLNSPLTVRRSDLSEWCVRGGADEARVLPGHNDAYSWSCYKGGAPSQPGINMLAYCQARHPKLNYVDFMLDLNNPSSWQCYGPVEKLGALLDKDPTGKGKDLTTYCRNHNTTLNPRGGTTVDHWYCNAVPIRTNYFGDFSMTQACRELYNNESAYARIADYFNPNSVECWGSNTAQSVPEAPFDVSLAPVSGGGGIGVSWKDKSNNEAGFDVFSRDTGMHIRVQPGQTFIASDWGGLTPGKQMCFDVFAYNGVGLSKPAPAATAGNCISIPGQ